MAQSDPSLSPGGRYGIGAGTGSGGVSAKDAINYAKKKRRKRKAKKRRVPFNPDAGPTGDPRKGAIQY